MRRSGQRNPTPRLWIRSGKRLVRLESFQNICGSETKSQTTSLLDLPDECIIMILDKLNLKAHELCQIMKVCKRFYELTFNPRLWRIVDFRFPRFLYTKKNAIYVDSRERHITELERRGMLVNFLVKRKSILTDLLLDCDVFDEFQTINCLIDKCCSRELKKVEIFKWFYPNYKRDVDEDIYFRKILTKLSAQCPLIHFVNSKVDTSYATAQILGTMSNIQHLELKFLGSIEHEKGTNAIEILLSNLKKLKTFKFKIRQDFDSDFPGLKLKSDSLEHLDYSWSKGFHVQYINLPRLHTYFARDIFQMYQGILSPCIFKLIENGCPSLTKLNFKTARVPGLVNFHLSDIDKENMHMCSCDRLQ